MSMTLDEIAAMYYSRQRKAQDATTGTERVAATLDVLSFSHQWMGHVIAVAQDRGNKLNQVQGRLSETLANNQDLLAQLQARDGLQQLATAQPHVAEAASDIHHDPNQRGHGAD